MNIAVIPARGGSKRIPKKNIRSFVSKPIISYSIETALASQLFDHVIVSTDDEEIAKCALEFGAKVPFVRPTDLATDQAATLPVMSHAVEWATESYGEIEFACCIYATAPFLREEDLSRGLQKLVADADADFAFSVTTFAFPIQRSLRIRSDDGRVEMYWPEHEGTRSQDLPEAYHDAGQFYWGRSLSFTSAPGIYSSRALPVVLPRHLVQDIDSLEDWERAELMFAALKRS